MVSPSVCLSGWNGFSRVTGPQYKYGGAINHSAVRYSYFIHVRVQCNHARHAAERCDHHLFTVCRSVGCVSTVDTLYTQPKYDVTVRISMYIHNIATVLAKIYISRLKWPNQVINELLHSASAYRIFRWYFCIWTKIFFGRALKVMVNLSSIYILHTKLL